MNKKYLAAIGAAVLVLLLAGCAATADPSTAVPGSTVNPTSVFVGFWHGFIMLITLIVSIFDPAVDLYETPNSGLLYKIGFVVGAGFFIGGAALFGSRR